MDDLAALAPCDVVSWRYSVTVKRLTLPVHDQGE